MGSSKSWRRFEYIYQYVALGQHSEHTMARGPVKHLKRMFAPSHWMLDKNSGRWAPKPSAGPHKMRECLPLIVMLRERLKYALTYRECKMIVMQNVFVIGKDSKPWISLPKGFMDVIQVDKK